MDAKTLASELVRARLAELDNMRTKLEAILRIQVQCETTIEENEARGYALAEALEGDAWIKAACCLLTCYSRWR
ncbi:hypothetical protein JG688_00017678 [Phytophthora aleatoria]|uniref:Uncharacterized protein n=1 Tax=Phytophthora aleatoria TaxID=2496075 RepID=A0A8J5IH26_9STRA|nr:hypothetical protein JG688_00017678 [Phytophthora aleatoria]